MCNYIYICISYNCPNTIYTQYLYLYISIYIYTRIPYTFLYPHRSWPWNKIHVWFPLQVVAVIDGKIDGWSNSNPGCNMEFSLETILIWTIPWTIPFILWI